MENVEDGDRRRTVVFRAPDDGKLWRFAYDYDNESFEDELVGNGTHKNPEPMRSEIEATLVEQRLIVTTVYEPLCEGREPTQAMHMRGRVLELGDVSGRGLLVELALDDLRKFGPYIHRAVDLIVTRGP